MNLTATIAGIDQDPRNEDQTELMYSMVKKFSEGATIMHSTRDKDEVRAEVKKAMESFYQDFFLASKNRREELLSDFESGKISEDELPRDVFTTLLRNAETLNLDEDIVFREICFYLQAGRILLPTRSLTP